MAIYSISDIAIAITLVVNALALMSGRVKPSESSMTRVKSSVSSSSFSSSSGDLQNDGSSFARLSQIASGRNNDSGGNGDDRNDTKESDKLLSSLHDTPDHSNGDSINAGPSSPRDLSSFGERIRQLIHGVRKLSCLILFWNFVFVILMLAVWGA